MGSDERETLGEVLAESVIGLSKHEMSGKGKKKKDRRKMRGSKEGKAERVRAGDEGQHPGAGTNHDARGRDPNHTSRLQTAPRRTTLYITPFSYSKPEMPSAYWLKNVNKTRMDKCKTRME